MENGSLSSGEINLLVVVGLSLAFRGFRFIVSLVKNEKKLVNPEIKNPGKDIGGK